MAHKNSDKDPYVYEGTDVLKNLAGIREGEELQEFETDASTFRNLQLARNPIIGKFDLTHLKAIHCHLFQDVYAWAGEMRTGDIAKGSDRFGSHLLIEGYARSVFSRLAQKFACAPVAGVFNPCPRKKGSAQGLKTPATNLEDQP